MPYHVTPERGRSFLAGIAVILVLAVLGYIMLTANRGRLPLAPTTTVKAAFTEIGQLDTNSEVRRNAKTIGEVETIELVGDRAVVTMKISDDFSVYRNARAELWDFSPLGQKYVELRPGDPAAGLLGDAVIPASQTGDAHSVEELFNIFDKPTRQALSSALTELGAGAAGHGKDLNLFLGAAPDLLEGVGRIATAAASPEADLAEFLDTTEQLSARFAGRSHLLTTLLRRTEATLQAVNVDDAEPLGQTIQRLPETLRDVEVALDAARGPLADTEAAMATLVPGAEALGTATPDLRGVLRESLEPLNTVPDVVEAAEPAVQELTRTLADARPLVPRVGEALASAVVPLRVLSPYAGDLAIFAYDLSNLIQPHVGYRHRLRIFPGSAPSLDALADLAPKPSNPYPEPGEAFAENGPTTDRDPNGGLIPGPGGSEP